MSFFSRKIGRPEETGLDIDPDVFQKSGDRGFLDLSIFSSGISRIMSILSTVVPKEDLQKFEDGLASGEPEPSPDDSIPNDPESFLQFLDRK